MLLIVTVAQQQESAASPVYCFRFSVLAFLPRHTCTHIINTAKLCRRTVHASSIMEVCSRRLILCLVFRLSFPGHPVTVQIP